MYDSLTIMESQLLTLSEIEILVQSYQLILDRQYCAPTSKSAYNGVIFVNKNLLEERLKVYLPKYGQEAELSVNPKVFDEHVVDGSDIFFLNIYGLRIPVKEFIFTLMYQAENIKRVFGGEYAQRFFGADPTKNGLIIFNRSEMMNTYTKLLIDYDAFRQNQQAAT